MLPKRPRRVIPPTHDRVVASTRSIHWTHGGAARDDHGQAGTVELPTGCRLAPASRLSADGADARPAVGLDRSPRADRGRRVERVPRGARFLDPVASCWALAARDATTHAPGRDVLLIGDSLVKHGLAPALLDQTAGSNSYNLAIAAGPAPATEALLRHALAAGVRPRAVVFDLKAGLLAGGPRYSLRQWPHVLDPLDAWRLIVTGAAARSPPNCSSIHFCRRFDPALKSAMPSARPFSATPRRSHA